MGCFSFFVRMIIAVKPVSETDTVNEAKDSYLPSLSLPPVLKKPLSRSPSTQSISEKLNPLEENTTQTAREMNTNSRTSLSTRPLSPQGLGVPSPSPLGVSKFERSRSPSLGILTNSPATPAHSCYLIAKGSGGIRKMSENFPDDKVRAWIFVPAMPWTQMFVFVNCFCYDTLRNRWLGWQCVRFIW